MPDFNQDSYNAKTATILAKLEELHTDVKEIRIESKDLQKRVISLENYRYFLAGGLALISISVSYIFHFLKLKKD